jgi:hypothetical protein
MSWKETGARDGATKLVGRDVTVAADFSADPDKPDSGHHQRRPLPPLEKGCGVPRTGSRNHAHDRDQRETPHPLADAGVGQGVPVEE